MILMVSSADTTSWVMNGKSCNLHHIIGVLKDYFAAFHLIQGIFQCYFCLILAAEDAW